MLVMGGMHALRNFVLGANPHFEEVGTNWQLAKALNSTLAERKAEARSCKFCEQD